DALRAGGPGRCALACPRPGRRALAVHAVLPAPARAVAQQLAGLRIERRLPTGPARSRALLRQRHRPAWAREGRRRLLHGLCAHPPRSGRDLPLPAALPPALHGADYAVPGPLVADQHRGDEHTQPAAHPQKRPHARRPPTARTPLTARSPPARRPLAARSKVLGSGGEHLRATHDQPLSDPVAAASPQVRGLFVVTPRPTDVGDRISADLTASLPVPLRLRAVATQLDRQLLGGDPVPAVCERP